MKKVKTITVLLLVALMAMSMVFAEGATETKSQGAGLTDVEMWYLPGQTEVGPLPNDWAGYQILKDKFGINLTAMSLPSAIQDQDMKIQAAAAADALPDFFYVTRETWIRLCEKGMLGDVTELYKLLPERTALMFDSAAMNYTKYDGKQYGFATPFNVTKNEGLLFRQDWLDNLGLKVPTTLDEFYDVLYAFRNNDPDGNGKKDTYGYGAFIEVNTYESYPGRRIQPIMGAFGVEGTWDMREASFGLQIKKPEFYDFMVFMRKLIENDLIDPNWMAYKKDDFRGAWKQGKFGCMREQNSALASQNNYTPFDTNFPNGSWTVADAPIGPKGHQSIGPLTKIMRIWAISADAIEKGKGEKIAKFFEWACHDEGYYICGWGVEGDQYTIGEDGLPKSLPGERGTDGAMGQRYIQLRPLAFNYVSDNELIARYPIWTKKNGEQISALWYLKDMRTRKWTDAVGSDALPIPSTDLKTYYEQGIAEFLTGKKPLTQENWANYIAMLDKLGAKEWEAKAKEAAKANGFLY